MNKVRHGLNIRNGPPARKTVGYSIPNYYGEGHVNEKEIYKELNNRLLSGFVTFHCAICGEDFPLKNKEGVIVHTHKRSHQDEEAKTRMLTIEGFVACIECYHGYAAHNTNKYMKITRFPDLVSFPVIEEV